MQDDQQYIDRILDSGSEYAVFALVKKYEKQVFNLCFRILRIREEAEEMAQDAFMKSFKELHKLEDKSKYGGWLMRITYHRAIDQTRKKKREMVSLEDQTVAKIEDDFFSNPLTNLENKERSDVIEMMLEGLPAIDNAIISLYYLDGFSVKEVAETTDLSESNVKIRLMRTRDLLKKNMNKWLRSETDNLY